MGCATPALPPSLFTNGSLSSSHDTSVSATKTISTFRNFDFSADLEMPRKFFGDLMWVCVSADYEVEHYGKG